MLLGWEVTYPFLQWTFTKSLNWFVCVITVSWDVTLCVYFNDTLSHSSYVALSVTVICEYWLWWLCREAIVTEFDVLLWYLTVRTEDVHRNPQSGYSVSWPRFNHVVPTYKSEPLLLEPLWWCHLVSAHCVCSTQQTEADGHVICWYLYAEPHSVISQVTVGLIPLLWWADMSHGFFRVFVRHFIPVVFKYHNKTKNWPVNTLYIWDVKWQPFDI